MVPGLATLVWRWAWLSFGQGLECGPSLGAWRYLPPLWLCPVRRRHCLAVPAPYETVVLASAVVEVMVAASEVAAVAATVVAASVESSEVVLAVALLASVTVGSGTARVATSVTVMAMVRAWEMGAVAP